MIKLFNYLIFTAVFSFGLLSCNDDDTLESLKNVESNKVENLHAPQETDYTTNPPTTSGEFVKFDFSSGKITSSSTNWDIAFRGTTILVNGGEQSGASSEPERTANASAYITKSSFANVTKVDSAMLKQDSSTGLAIPTGSGNGWYTYDSTSHTITATPGRVIVVKTEEGNFAKMEILNYYKNMDSSKPENGRYYTFKYIYQPNSGVTTFE